MHLALQLLVLAVLIFCNGAFALSELALVSSRRAMLTLMERKGIRGAAKARVLADNPQAYLPASQFGITLIGILTGVFGGAQLGGVVAAPLAKLPVVGAYAGPTRAVLSAFGPAGEDRRAVSEEELKAMLVEGAETGVLEHEERDMIERVLRLADKPVRAIMTPRTEIAWIDRTAPKAVIVAALRAAPHSRFVVCDGAIDNVAGIVQAKDILDRVLDGKEFSLAAALRQPMAIPDSVSALEALERLKSDFLGIALVLDEYGSFEGMVTAADVLEAIVGDAEDFSGPVKEGAVAASADEYLFEGLMAVDETKARLHLPDLPNEGSYHTLGGLILALLMRPPRVGDAIVFGGWKFEVVEMDGRRVERVRVARDLVS